MIPFITVGTLAYQVVGNTAGLTAGLTATRSELKTLKAAFMESQTPVERYGMAVNELERLAQKFPEKADQIRRSIAAMNDEIAKLNVDPKQTWLNKVRANSIQQEFDDNLKAVQDRNTRLRDQQERHRAML